MCTSVTSSLLAPNATSYGFFTYACVALATCSSPHTEYDVTPLTTPQFVRITALPKSNGCNPHVHFPVRWPPMHRRAPVAERHAPLHLRWSGGNLGGVTLSRSGYLPCSCPNWLLPSFILPYPPPTLQCVSLLLPNQLPWHPWPWAWRGQV